MPKFVTILEDIVRYRDGRKWKRRYCMLTKPDPKTGAITMYITKQSGINCSVTEIDDKTLRQYIIDDITGFEYGRHIDKEGSVMALICRNIVYCIAFAQNETMFRWVNTLEKYVKYAHFHVTLKNISESSGLFNKIQPGLQGNLHIQEARLCLIAEPADGNKFISEWPVESIMSIDFFETDQNKVKRLKIKSNGKLHKVRGTFEFEICFNQKSLFKSAFQIFLSKCSKTNSEFRTNFVFNRESVDLSLDNFTFISTTLSQESSENSSSLEKRSSEIPIPRSREHSGPDQRPIDDVQLKIRKSNKNFQKFMNEKQNQFSSLDLNPKSDQNSCLFAADEEIENQNSTKDKNLLLCGLSQDSSGVDVNGASGSLRETNLSAHILIQDDSGCGNLSNCLYPSTSCNQRDLINLPSNLPPCQKRCSPKGNPFLLFYRSVNRNPLLLSNYRKYFHLLKLVAKNPAIVTRCNSYNSVNFLFKNRIQCRRKYSHNNLGVNISRQSLDLFQGVSKFKSNSIIIDRPSLNTNFEEVECSTFVSSKFHSMSKRLPFHSCTELHDTVINAIKNGTSCYHLLFYDNFLYLMKNFNLILKLTESGTKSVKDENGFERNKISPQTKRFYYDRIQSYFVSTLPQSLNMKEDFIYDLNIQLIIEMVQSIIYKNSLSTVSSCDFSHSNNSSCETHNADYYMNVNVHDHELSEPQKYNPTYLSSEFENYISCSTPDFRCYYQNEQTQKLYQHDSNYQNVSSLEGFHSANHTFPKHNMSFSKGGSSQKTSGSFKKFRRKYSPSFLIPFLNFGSSKLQNNSIFMRRKTPSTQSTLSEPSCREQNMYYNVVQHKQPFTKRSLSVVFDSSYPFEKDSESHNYYNVDKESSLKQISNDCLNNSTTSIPDENFVYPEEILDPSRNYGRLDLNSKFKFIRQDSENDSLSHYRRSSFTVSSNKSLQNYGSYRSTSFNKHAYSNLTQTHSDASNCNYPNASDLQIGTAFADSSPQSTKSYSPGRVVSSLHHRIPPKSLNYITLMGNESRKNAIYKYSMPLSINTQNDYLNIDCDSEFGNTNRRMFSSNNNPLPKRNHLTPQSSPVCDYCQIDLHGTYALRDIDIKLKEKKSRGHVSPADNSLDFYKSYEEMSDTFSGVSLKDHRKQNHKQHHFSNRKYLRRFFTRKSEFAS